MEQIALTVQPEQGGQRIDVYLAAHTDFSRAFIQTCCKNNEVFCNGINVDKKYIIKAGDTIVVSLPLSGEKEAVQPQDIPIEVVYEDEDILIVNKPRGMVVHPAPGHERDTLVNGLLYRYPNSLSTCGEANRPGIVHRIDKDTSGLLMVAKNNTAHHHLAQQIKEHDFLRRYHAVVHGVLKQEQGWIDAPLGRHPIHRQRIAVIPEGREAKTHFKVLEQFPQYTFLELELHTGRTHQIRVHMQHLGYPVAGDLVYGPKKTVLSGGQCLHASTLGFHHPTTGEYMEFNSPLPPYFTAFLNRLHNTMPL